jgi:hypothetical protein
VAAQDSVDFTVGYPIDGSLNVIVACGDTTADGTWRVTRFYPDSLIIGTGGVVSVVPVCGIQIPDEQTWELVFDDPTVNVSGKLLIRVTPTKPGTYTFHSPSGGTGTVIASDGP